MTIATEVARNDYVGTGLVATYPYTFRVYSSAELLVVRRVNGVETTLILTTDYTVTGVNADGGGTIVLTANLASDAALAVIRAPDFVQGTDLRRGTAFSPTVIETALDRLTTQTIALQEELSRAIKLPASEAGTPAKTTLPSAAFRANLHLAFNASGNPVATAGGSGGSSTGTMVLGTGNGVADDLAAIQAAQVTAGPGGAIVFGPGTFLISAPLILNTSFHGAGIGETIIKASASFVGDRMFSLNNGVDSLSFTDMTLDANDRVGVDIIKGNASLTDTKANRLYCRDVWFYNSHANSYCLYTDETNNLPGGLVGSLFEMCRFEGVGNNLYFGNNEDDITFLNCRFHNHKLATAGYCYYLQGVNTRFEGCYFYFNATDYLYAGERFLFFVHAYGYTFANCFFEYGHSALNAIFLGITVMATAAFQSCHFNLSSINIVNFKSFFRGNLSSASVGYRHEVSFRDCVKYDVLDYPLAHIYVDGSTSDYSVWWDLIVENCGLWNTIPRLCTKSGKSGALNIYVRIAGHNAGGGIATDPTMYGIPYVDDESPGLWLHDVNSAANPAIKDAFFVLVDNDLTVQRRANAHGGAYEAAPFRWNITAPNNSMVIDATGQATFIGAIDAVTGYIDAIYMQTAAPIIQMSEDALLDGAAVAFDVQKLVIQRRAPAFGGNEATIIEVDIQAPANSVVLDAAGYTKMLGAIIDTGSLYFRDGAGSDQAYFDYASDLLTINRASAAGAYEATLFNFNIQTGNLQVQSLNSVGSIWMEQAGAADRIYWDLFSDQLTLNRASSINAYEATLVSIAIQAPADSLRINSSGTVTVGVIGTTSSGNVIAGVQNGSADTAGAVGQTLVSTVSGIAAAATGVVGNITSLAVTRGKWRLSGLSVISGGATGLTSGSTVKLSIVSVTATNGVSGSTMAQESVLALLANGLFEQAIPDVIINISADTTYYLTAEVSYASGAPTFAATFTAERIR